MVEKRNGEERRRDRGRRSFDKGTLESLAKLIEKIRSGKDRRAGEERRNKDDRRGGDGGS